MSKNQSNFKFKGISKNKWAISFYQREQFVIQSEHIDNDNSEKEFIMTWNK
jgi:putative acetyltransferase